MKNFHLKAALLCIIASFTLCLSSQESKTEKKDVGMDLFLLIGQSNMAGRGQLDSEKIDLEGVYVINKNNEWVNAKDPIHYDKAVAGTGLAATFAIDVKNKSERKIGLIPCAIGGTSIDLWAPDIVDPVTKMMPYNQTVERAKKALQSGQLKGILWHQGESDSGNGRYVNYGDRFDVLLKNLSEDLSFNLDSIPVIVGELGPFFSSQARNKEAICIDSILHQKATAINIYCVSSQGLTHKGDSTHFDTPSLRELGKRYAKGYQIVLDRLRNF